MAQTEEEIYLSWDEIEGAIFSLAEAIKQRGSAEAVIGISRGGLPGAVMLSHALDLPLVTVKAELYEGKEKQGQVDVRDVGRLDGDPNVLIFDEKVATGETMAAVRGIVEQETAGVVRTASIHLGPNPGVVPDFWVEETDHWVVYPWEISL